MEYIFEWDDEKAQANRQRHDVTFIEAQTVFLDPLSLTIFDAQHSDHEDRYIDIGRSTSGRLLVVVYTERGDRIRIISSRVASPAERRTYEQKR